MVKRHALFIHYVKGKVVCVIDQGRSHFLTVTNDAEFVVEQMLETYGNMPIVYRDSCGQWDQLCHDGKKFTHYNTLYQKTEDGAIAALNMV